MRRRSKQTTVTTKELGGGRGIYSRAKVLGALALLAFPLFVNFSIPLNPYAYHDNNLDLGKSSTKKGQHFWEHEPSCFHLDRICHRDDIWFYDHPVDVEGGDLHQPTITLDMPDKIVHGSGEVSIDDRIHFTVRQRERWRLRIFSQANNRQCHYSDTPYHVVVQSSYNDMMCEFYVRSVLGLNEWMRKFPLQLSSLKFYIHFATERNQLFEGHRLFLGENTTDNFSSLIIPQFRQPKSCQCYEKLVFCGYNRWIQHATFTTAGYIGHPSSKTLNEYLKRDLVKKKNRAYQRLRQDLLARHTMRDPMLNEKVRQHRHSILQSKNISKEEVITVNDWKIVGLTKRLSRRKWLNIDEIVTHCDASFAHLKVVCITVNVEETTTVEEQLLMHMSLDALVGIRKYPFVFS